MHSSEDTSQDRDSGSRSPAVMEPRHSEVAWLAISRVGLQAQEQSNVAKAHGKGEEPAMEMKVLETGMLFTEGLLEDNACSRNLPLAC